VRVEWTNGPSADNGAYGLYPVQCTNVLIEDSVVIGASDAGIYVGQSQNIVLRRNRAEFNVAGIEIENSQDADVYDNVATRNTGGILVFNLPGLPVKDGRRTRVFRNRIFANDTPNFAPPGNIVGSVPTGTGVMLMANDDVEVFDNDIEDNGSFGVLVISFRTAQLIGGFQANDPLFDPYSEGIHVHSNRFADNGTDPDPATADLVRPILGLPGGAPLPTVVTDGDVDPAKLVGGELPGELRTCVPEPVPSFADLDVGNGFANPTTSTAGVQCTLAPVSPASVEGIELGALPPDLPPTVLPPGSSGDEETRCALGSGTGVNFDPEALTCDLLSSYRFFLGDGATQEPNEGVVPYDLATQLFSDYAHKRRFVYVPPGTSATYSSVRSFQFPVGSALIKTFSYPYDERDPAAGERLIETRLLLRRADRWVGVTYRWNEVQTEAVLRVIGDDVPVEWLDAAGEPRATVFHVPDANQCKECHAEEAPVVGPLGPKARNLNKDYPYASGVDNQLDHWSRLGILAGAPASSDAPRAAVLDDPDSGSLEERARTYLDVNCASCHNPLGLARTSGLYLTASETSPTALGICRSPVAAGGGAGDRRYDIEPGRPDRSILIYRMESTEPGVAMPELGRQLAHAEAVALLREWIASLPGSCGQ
jgi:parallel beta-helix repeat protein